MYVVFTFQSYIVSPALGGRSRTIPGTTVQDLERASGLLPNDVEALETWRYADYVSAMVKGRNAGKKSKKKKENSQIPGKEGIPFECSICLDPTG